MLQAFTLLNNSKLKAELTTARIITLRCLPLLVRALDPSGPRYFYNKKHTVRQQKEKNNNNKKKTRAPVDPIRKPGPLCRSRKLSRQVRIHGEAATIENHQTPHYSFWQSAEQPCKLHPRLRHPPLLRYRRLTGRSEATTATTPTPPTSQLEITGTQ
jgi:hypothetical protein